MFIFGKKGKPLDSVAAILKTSPENSCGQTGLENLEAYTKIREKLCGLLTNSKS